MYITPATKDQAFPPQLLLSLAYAQATCNCSEMVSGFPAPKNSSTHQIFTWRICWRKCSCKLINCSPVRLSSRMFEDLYPSWQGPKFQKIISVQECMWTSGVWTSQSMESSTVRNFFIASEFAAMT